MVPPSWLLVMWLLHLMALHHRSAGSGSPASTSRKLRLPPLRNVMIPTIASHVAAYCLSYLHADSEKNQIYVRERCLRPSGDQQAFTVMIVPGDIGAEVDRMAEYSMNWLPIINSRPSQRCWIRHVRLGGKGLGRGSAPPRAEDSARNRMAPRHIHKLNEILETSEECGVFAGPVRFKYGSRDLWVVPLQLVPLIVGLRTRADSPRLPSRGEGRTPLLLARWRNWPRGSSLNL